MRTRTTKTTTAKTYDEMTQDERAAYAASLERWKTEYELKNKYVKEGMDERSAGIAAKAASTGDYETLTGILHQNHMRQGMAELEKRMQAAGATADQDEGRTEFERNLLAGFASVPMRFDSVQKEKEDGYTPRSAMAMGNPMLEAFASVPTRF